MAFDGLHVAVLIETTQALPLVLPAEPADGASQSGHELASETERAGTLENALHAAGRSGADGAAHREVVERHDMLDADLWVSRSRTTATDTRTQIEKVGDFNHDPRAADATIVDAVQARPNDDITPAGVDPLKTKPLARAEIGHAIGGRQFDSTDWGWEEMSTGDYEWALSNFRTDVEAGVQHAIVNATSDNDAIQITQNYLNSLGLGGIVHIGGAATGDGSIVFVTGDRHTPTAYMPTLTMDYWALANLNTHDIYQAMDEASIDINVNVDGPLTEAQQHALAELRQQITHITQMLNSLPANGIFIFPDGKIASVAELRALWVRTDFLVTSQNYSSAGTPFQPGAGIAIYNNGDPRFEININQLVIIMSNPFTALAYPLHELSHVTANGQVLGNTSVPSGEDYTNYFNRSEGYADQLALAIISASGIPVSDGWRALFEIHTSQYPAPTFSVPTTGADGSGGGGSGAGGSGGGGDNGGGIGGGGYIGG